MSLYPLQAATSFSVQYVSSVLHTSFTLFLGDMSEIVAIYNNLTDANSKSWDMWCGMDKEYTNTEKKHTNNHGYLKWSMKDATRRRTQVKVHQTAVSHGTGAEDRGFKV